MRAVVIGNRGDDDSGFVGTRLRARGYEIVPCSREDPGSLEDRALASDLVVLLGSDWSVYDPEHAACVAAEQELVRRAFRCDLPVLGICYGGQLIASALGLEVRRAVVPEIGWSTILTADPGQLPPGPWFQYHFDRWVETARLPACARTETGPQAFWYGRALALQFHPEVTAETIERWCTAGAHELAAAGFDLARVLDESAGHIEDSRLRCFSLVDGFLERAGSARYPSGVLPPGRQAVSRTRSVPSAGSDGPTMREPASFS